METVVREGHGTFLRHGSLCWLHRHAPWPYEEWLLQNWMMVCMGKFKKQVPSALLTRYKTEWVIVAFFLPLLRIQLSMACRRTLFFGNTGHEAHGEMISGLAECPTGRAKLKCYIIQRSRARTRRRVHSFTCWPSTYLVHATDILLDSIFPSAKWK